MDIIVESGETLQKKENITLKLWKKRGEMKIEKKENKRIFILFWEKFSEKNEFQWMNWVKGKENDAKSGKHDFLLSSNSNQEFPWSYNWGCLDSMPWKGGA